MNIESYVLYTVFGIIGLLITGVTLIYLADYIIEWNNHRPWKLAKRVWDYTEEWENLVFYLTHARIQLSNKGLRYREKQGLLNGDAW